MGNSTHGLLKVNTRGPVGALFCHPKASKKRGAWNGLLEWRGRGHPLRWGSRSIPRQSMNPQVLISDVTTGRGEPSCSSSIALKSNLGFLVSIVSAGLCKAGEKAGGCDLGSKPKNTRDNAKNIPYCFFEILKLMLQKRGCSCRGNRRWRGGVVNAHRGSGDRFETTF